MALPICKTKSVKIPTWGRRTSILCRHWVLSIVAMGMTASSLIQPNKKGQRRPEGGMKLGNHNWTPEPCQQISSESGCRTTGGELGGCGRSRQPHRSTSHIWKRRSTPPSRISGHLSPRQSSALQHALVTAHAHYREERQCDPRRRSCKRDR